MIIRREKLIELARGEAERRAETGDVISGYVIGSLASGDPLFGGAADIDLVLIHGDEPDAPHEVVPLSEDVHLDIVHYPRSLYANPRSLRVDPWLGPSMCEPLFLYDPSHFFEWAQAGVRGRFHRSDHVHARAVAFLKQARRTWDRLSRSNGWLQDYTNAVLEGANAVVSLGGFPVAGRRLALALEDRTARLGAEEVYTEFLVLLGAGAVDRWEAPAWIAAWARAFDAAARVSSLPWLHPSRRAYYLRGFQALLEAGRPECVTWTLLASWDRSIRALAAAGEAADHHASWVEVLQRLGLSPAFSESRAAQLDRYLDHIERLVERWAVRNGA